MPVRVYCHLNGAVSRLLFDIGKRCPILDEQATKGMAQIVKPESSKAGMLDAREKITLYQIVRVENCALRGREHQFICDAALAFFECFQEPLIAKLEKSAPQMLGEINSPTSLALGRSELPGDVIVPDQDEPVRVIFGITPNWMSPQRKATSSPRRRPPRSAVKNIVVFNYQNANFILAGAMIERCTGKSWEDLMKTEIFQPLGMTTAGFGAPGTVDDVNEPWGRTDASGQRVANKGDNTPGLGPAGTVHASLNGTKVSRLQLNPVEL